MQPYVEITNHAAYDSVRVSVINLGHWEGYKFTNALPQSFQELDSLYKLCFTSTNDGTLGGDSLTIPDWINKDNTPLLKDLTLNSCGYIGEIPPTIFSLDSLEILAFAGNTLLGDSMQIPTDINASNFPNLKFLDLRDCMFGGDIPISLSTLVKLEGLLFENLPLNEQVFPSWINDNLTSLGQLSTWNCNFIGNFPSLENLNSLWQLFLGYNNFDPQAIPEHLFDLPIIDLSLPATNLTDTISYSDSLNFAKWLDLERIDLSGNNLVIDTFPTWFNINVFPDLRDIGLDECEIQHLETIDLDTSKLQHINLGDNKLEFPDFDKNRLLYQHLQSKRLNPSYVPQDSVDLIRYITVWEDQNTIEVEANSKGDSVRYVWYRDGEPINDQNRLNSSIAI